MLLDELRTSRPVMQPEGMLGEAGRSSYRLAQEIVSIVPPALITRLEEYPDRIQFRIASSDGWRLRRIVLGRESLEKLERDPQREVKLEYLQRDLANAGSTRRIWSYPRTMALR